MMPTDNDRATAKLIELYERQIKIATYVGFDNPAHLTYADQSVHPREIEALKLALHECMPMFRTFMQPDQIVVRKHYGSAEELLRPDVVSWPEAQNLVTQSFHEFSPRLGTLTEHLFAQGFVHPVADQSTPGAVVQSCYRDMPEVVVAFQGRLQDAREMSRKLGQAAAVVMRHANGHQSRKPSIFIDSLCADFGEKLVWSPSARKQHFQSGLHLTITAEAVSDIIRYSMLEQLQQSVTELCKRKECNGENLDRAWGKILNQHSGTNILPDQGNPSWRDYNHLYQQPYMGIANLYAQLSSNQLWNLFEKDRQQFPRQYMTFMANTSSASGHELLARFGCDTMKPKYWNTAIVSVMSQYVGATRALIHGLNL